MTDFFPTEPVRYEGPNTETELAYRVYDPDRVLLGKRMEDHLRIAVCYWHSFNWPGNDVFGVGTFDRPWLAYDVEPMKAAHQKMDAAFEFFSNLGTVSVVPTTCSGAGARDTKRCSTRGCARKQIN